MSTLDFYTNNDEFHVFLSWPHLYRYLGDRNWLDGLTAKTKDWAVSISDLAGRQLQFFKKTSIHGLGRASWIYQHPFHIEGVDVHSQNQGIIMGLINPLHVLVGKC